MNDPQRKKSPRAPSLPLDEALERATRAYEKEGLQGAPIDLVAQHLGYKNANSGAALQAIASLRYYGLVERKADAVLAVVKDVEAYRFAPDEGSKRALLRGFLRRPAVFAELLDRFHDGLPSDAVLRDELVQRGFLPSAANSLAEVFRKSAAFARYFDAAEAVPRGLASPRADLPASDSPRIVDEAAGHDRIPVRLGGGRRAWLVIPPVFHQADKLRLKAQIDLLLTEEEAGGASD